MNYKQLRSYFLDNMEHFPQTLYAGYIYYPNVKETAKSYIEQIDSSLKSKGREAANKHRPTLAALGNLNKIKKHLEHLEGWDVPRPKKFEFWSNIIIPIKKKSKRK